jgi:hypothetical protein
MGVLAYPQLSMLRPPKDHAKSKQSKEDPSRRLIHGYPGKKKGTDFYFRAEQ